MANCLDQISDLPTCIGPQIFQYVNSVSDVLAEDSTSHWPDLSFGQDETIKGSCESLSKKWALNFDDFSTAVSFLTGRGHGEQEE